MFEEKEEGTDLASDGAHGKQPRVCIRVCMHTYMNNRPIFLPRTTRSSGFPSEDVCFRRFHGAVVSSIPTPCNALHSAPFKPKNTFFGQISGSSQMRRSAVRGVVRLFSGRTYVCIRLRFNAVSSCLLLGPRHSNDPEPNTSFESKPHFCSASCP